MFEDDNNCNEKIMVKRGNFDRFLSRRRPNCRNGTSENFNPKTDMDFLYCHLLLEIN